MFNFDFSQQFALLKKGENIFLIVCIIILNFVNTLALNFFKDRIGFFGLSKDKLISSSLVFGLIITIFFGIFDFILGKLFPYSDKSFIDWVEGIFF